MHSAQPAEHCLTGEKKLKNVLEQGYVQDVIILWDVQKAWINMLLFCSVKPSVTSTQGGRFGASHTDAHILPCKPRCSIFLIYTFLVTYSCERHAIMCTHCSGLQGEGEKKGVIFKSSCYWVTREWDLLPSPSTQLRNKLQTSLQNPRRLCTQRLRRKLLNIHLILSELWGFTA